MAYYELLTGTVSQARVGLSGRPSWAFDPANVAEVAGYSFWIAVLSLGITVAGFGVAIWQLSKTKSATEATREETERLQESLYSFKLANEVIRATAALKTARAYIREGLWTQASDSYELVLDGLDAIRAESDGITDEHIADIEKAARFIKNFLRRVEKDRVEGTATIDASKTIAVMNGHRLLLRDLTRVIEKGAIS